MNPLHLGKGQSEVLIHDVFHKSLSHMAQFCRCDVKYVRRAPSKWPNVNTHCYNSTLFGDMQITTEPNQSPVHVNPYISSAVTFCLASKLSHCGQKFSWLQKEAGSLGVLAKISGIVSLLMWTWTIIMQMLMDSYWMGSSGVAALRISDGETHGCFSVPSSAGLLTPMCYYTAGPEPVWAVLTGKCSNMNNREDLMGFVKF